MGDDEAFHFEKGKGGEEAGDVEAGFELKLEDVGAAAWGEDFENLAFFFVKVVMFEFFLWAVFNEVLVKKCWGLVEECDDVFC